MYVTSTENLVNFKKVTNLALEGGIAGRAGGDIRGGIRKGGGGVGFLSESVEKDMMKVRVICKYKLFLYCCRFLLSTELCRYLKWEEKL